MSDLEEEAPVAEAPLVRKGRPMGRPDSTQRKRRTAQEISDDKIKVATMKLEPLKEIERDKLANKKKRAPPAQVRKAATNPYHKSRAEAGSDSDSDGPPGLPDPRTSRMALYDSWFKK